MKISMLFWVVMPSVFVGGCQRLEEAYYLLLRAESEDRMFLRNAGICLRLNTVSELERTKSTFCLYFVKRLCIHTYIAHNKKDINLFSIRVSLRLSQVPF
jgi:hypothetical protein